MFAKFFGINKFRPEAKNEDVMSRRKRKVGGGMADGGAGERRP